MNKAEILQRLSKLNLDKKEYWVLAGSAMVIYGLRENTGDIDLGCSSKLADSLEKTYNTSLCSDGSRKIVIDKDIEVFENWLFYRVNIVSNVPVISLKGLRKLKENLNREKDIKDIQLIDEYLHNK